MHVYARHFGADKHTFYGLAGIGDLMLTSTLVQSTIGFGKLSRNRSFGVKIGQGESLESILQSSKGVVEGVPTMELLCRDAERLNLDLPLTTTMHKLIKGKISSKEALQFLLNLKLTEEFPPTFEDLLN
jgi:glycerol-3-phosphate dehydrogenase